jgi:hypothetical protein
MRASLVDRVKRRFGSVIANTFLRFTVAAFALKSLAF